jgi:hypothetical protein
MSTNLDFTELELSERRQEFINLFLNTISDDWEVTEDTINDSILFEDDMFTVNVSYEKPKILSCISFTITNKISGKSFTDSRAGVYSVIRDINGRINCWRIFTKVN